MSTAPFSAGTISSWNLCRVCAFCHRLWKFLCALVLLYMYIAITYSCDYSNLVKVHDFSQIIIGLLKKMAWCFSIGDDAAQNFLLFCMCLELM